MAQYTNLSLDQATDFSTTVTVHNQAGTVINLTGATGIALMRKSYYSGLNVYAMGVTIPAPATAGNVTLTMSAAATQSVPPGRYFYDVSTTASGLTSRVLQGIVVVNPSATNFNIDANIGATGATGIGPSAYYGSTSYIYWRYDSTLKALGATSVMPGV